MLTEQEKRFIEYWRERRKSNKTDPVEFIGSMLIGFLFSSPIVLFFLLEGRRDRAMVTPTDLILICFGALCIAVFYGVMRSRFLKDRNEEKYFDLLNKVSKEDSK